MNSGPLATLRLMRACHPHLKGRGSIVNLGSAAGLKWDPTGTGAYAAAKEAVRVLTRTAACEWGSDGIRVNAVLPLASTPLMDEWAELNPERTGSICGACRSVVWVTPSRTSGRPWCSCAARPPAT